MNDELKKQIQQLLNEKRFDELSELYAKILNDLIEDPSVKNATEEDVNIDILNAYLEANNEVLDHESSVLKDIIEMSHECSRVDKRIEDNDKIIQARKDLNAA